jgi:hypothetical protein
MVVGMLALACTLISASAEDTKLKVGDFEFSHGEDFKALENTSPMVKAKMEFTDAESKETASLSFYYFGAGQGGSTAANVERWKKQFDGEPKIETTKVKYGETLVTVIHAKGTYLDGPPFGTKTPREGYALLGAIIEGESAPVFLKMTGSEKAVEAARKAFDKLVSSPFGETKAVPVKE